jgi:hypothetical protein
MSQYDLPPRSRASLAVDAVLTLAVFVFLTWIMTGHVPSNDPFNIWFWAAMTALCMTAVFWLALQMFRAVLRKQREAGRK